MYKKINKKGFTLIEMLVVISVIGLLASVVLVSLRPSQADARDARRISDLKNLEIALELYIDRHGEYPPATSSERTEDTSVGATGAGCVECAHPNGSDWDSGSNLRELVVENFIVLVPIDPLNDSTYNYDYEPGPLNCSGAAICSTYSLQATLEDGSTFCVGPDC